MTSEDDFRLEDARVAILGLGLMGGSLALALRGRCRLLLGSDNDPATLELARNLNLVDRCAADPAEILPLADLVILAVPIRAILKILSILSDLHPGSPVVMDLGSTKELICRAMEALPPRFEAIGGHPMCGKEISSLVNAEAGLYQGARFVLVAHARSGPRAVHLATQVAMAAGAVPVWFDAATHDRWVAGTSHLPFLIANSLARVTPLESALLAGPGYRSTARLSVSQASMMRDIVETNCENVQAALESFQSQIRQIHALLASQDFDRLAIEFQIGADQQKAILHDSDQGGKL